MPKCSMGISKEPYRMAFRLSLVPQLSSLSENRYLPKSSNSKVSESSEAIRTSLTRYPVWNFPRLIGTVGWQDSESQDSPDQKS